MALFSEKESHAELPIREVGIQILQNALLELNLPYSHINESHIKIKDPRNTFFRRGKGRLIDESRGFIDEETGNIIVIDGTDRIVYPPNVLLRIEEHEGAHFIGAEVLSRILHIHENTKIIRKGYSLHTGEMRYFAGFDEASAEEFAAFALREGQNILAQYPEFIGTQILPAATDVDDSYIPFRLALKHIKQQYQDHFGLSQETVERLFLRGMASPDASFLIGLEQAYDSDALIMLGLYGSLLSYSTWWHSGYESETNANHRDFLISRYFQTDEELVKSQKLLQAIKMPQDVYTNPETARKFLLQTQQLLQTPSIPEEMFNNPKAVRILLSETQQLLQIAKLPEEIINDPQAIRILLVNKVKENVRLFDKKLFQQVLQLPQIARQVFA